MRSYTRHAASTVALLIAVAASSASGAEVASSPGPDRSGPPAPGPVPSFDLPVPQRFTLSNGVPVFWLERHKVPVVDLVLIVRSGAASDPRDLPGVADWTTQMLTEGAGGKSSLELADAVDFLGARLSAEATWDWIEVSLHTPSARLPQALSLLADVILRPEFPAKEWDRLRAERRTAFLQSRDEPWSLARIARHRALYGTAHRYGTPVSGTPGALERVALDDLRKFHKTHFRPDNILLVVAGDADRDRLSALLENALSKWRSGGSPPSKPSLPAAPPIERAEIVLVDKPDAPQSVLAVVAHAPGDLRPLDATDTVMNTLLGGSFSSRLNQNLRETHGYSYGAASMFDFRLHGVSFLALSAVAADVTAPALREMLNEIERIRKPAREDEVLRAKRYEALGFPARFETNASVAGTWAWAEALGVEPTRLQSFMKAADAVDAKSLVAAARRDLDPKRMRFVVVGDRAKVEGPLEKLQIGPIRVWTVDDLLGPRPSEERHSGQASRSRRG